MGLQIDVPPSVQGNAQTAGLLMALMVLWRFTIDPEV